MTQTSQVDGARATRPAPLPPVRERGPVGTGFHMRVFVLEIAVIAAVVAAVEPVWWTLTIAGVALAGVPLALLRRRGQWWYQYWALRRRFRRRAAATAGIPSALATLAPDLTVRQVIDRQTRLGVGQDADGWFMGFTVAPWTGLNGSRTGSVTLDRLARILGESPIPVSAMQLVTQVVPAPTAVLDRRVPCTQSYQELLGDADLPVLQRIYLAVRLRPADAEAAAASRGGGVDGVHRALAALAGRISKSLHDARVLDADGLASALTSAATLEGAEIPGAGPGSERWDRWHTSEASAVCYALTGVSGPGLYGLTRRLGRTPARSWAVSTTLSPTRDGGIALDSLLRVTAGTDDLQGTLRQVAEAAAHGGIRLTRLDGEQAPAVYATAPTARSTR